VLDLRRRDLIALFGAATAAWALSARAQTSAAVRRVGLLTPFVADTDESRKLMGVFFDGLRELGWIDGRNVKIEQRWSSGDHERLLADARLLAELPADVVLAVSSPAIAALQQEAPRVPVVFVAVSDPVGSGFVGSLARPGGNITGFVNLEGSLSGKWLGLLKELVPGLTHAGFMFNPGSAPFAEYYLRQFEAAAPVAAVAPVAVPVHEVADIERAIVALKARPVAGLVVMPDTFTTVNRRRIIELAARERLPVVYPNGATVRQGGLIGYGVDNVESVRGAATYIDRILRGEKPGDLPVQTPTKFELVINLKTAAALGLTVPPALTALADEVVE
jgi:putative tryptophan/tyrosine transport system substrate-binding protein